VSKEFDNPKGVPISAIIFGGRRTKLIPLVYESFNWQHGVFCGARMASETTAATTHHTGMLRRDPMAMISFCGYNMADYFGHWLGMDKRMKHAPRIFCVNWFRIDEQGKFMWPGFGENIRVLKWMIDRIENRVSAKETPIGRVPHLKDLEMKGLKIPKENLEKLFEVKPDEWKPEVEEMQKFFGQFGRKMPDGIVDELNNLKRKVNLA